MNDILSVIKKEKFVTVHFDKIDSGRLQEHPPPSETWAGDALLIC